MQGVLMLCQVVCAVSAGLEMVNLVLVGRLLCIGNMYERQFSSLSALW